jgi:hypothetical protein
MGVKQRLIARREVGPSPTAPLAGPFSLFFSSAFTFTLLSLLMSRLAMTLAAVAGAVGAAAWLLLDPADEDKQRKQQQQQPRRRSLHGAAAPVAVRESSLQLRGSTASASSKVLLTGGYLILEPEFSGLVLALDARFRTALLALTPAAARQLQLAPRTQNSAPILVYAPQRCDTPARYELSWVPSEVADASGASSGGWKLRAAAVGQEKNKFVEQSIVVSAAVLLSTARKRVAWHAALNAAQ